MSRIGTPPPTQRAHAPAPPGPTSATEVIISPSSPAAKEGCCAKALRASCTSIAGALLYALSLYLVSWNEFQTVCTQKKLIQAADHVHDIDCTTESVLHDNSGDLVFLSCSIDAIPEWGIQAFPNMDRLVGIFKERAVAMKQVAEMVQCQERRSQTEEKVQDGQKKTTTHSYSKVWSEHHIDDSTFNKKYAAERENACGTALNPKFPTSTTIVRAPSLSAGLYDMSKDDLESIPIDTRIDFDGLPLYFFQRTSFETIQPPQRPSKFNAVAANGSIWTCDPFSSTPPIGCMRFSYHKASATHVHVLAELDERSNRGRFRPWDADPSWGCPAKSKVNRLKYFGSSTGHTTADQVLMILASTDKIVRWTLRVLGVILAVISVYLGLSPIRLALDATETSLRSVLKKTPLVGSLLDDFASFIAGVTATILFLVSSGFGVLSALLMMFLVWALMRPLITIPIIVIIVFGLASGFLHIVARGQEKKNEKGK